MTSTASIPLSVNQAIGLGRQYLADIPLLKDHALKWASTIVKCLTPAMGTHEVKCRCCGEMMAELNSCRQRFCPLCAGPRVLRFIEAWKRRLLFVHHYHLTFTLPHEGNILWRMNPRQMGEIFFASVSYTLKKLMADPQWLGADPGFICCLQTWDNFLRYHPHMHVILTAGGVDKDGNWHAMVRGETFLIPVHKIRRMVRGVFMRLLRERIADGTIKVPAEWNGRQARRRLDKMKEKRFVVWITGPYPNGLTVLLYLAKYVCSGPVPNSKLVAVTQKKVTFLLAPRIDSAEVETTLTLADFVSRVMMHVPPPWFHMVRSYGLYSPSMRVKAKGLLRQSDADPVMMAEPRQEDLPIDEPYCCPTCRGFAPVAYRSTGMRMRPASSHWQLARDGPDREAA